MIHKLWLSHVINALGREWLNFNPDSLEAVHCTHQPRNTHVVCEGGSGVAACPGDNSVLGHNMSIDRGSIWYYPTSRIGTQNITQVVGIAEFIKNGSSIVELTLNIILVRNEKIMRPIWGTSREIPGWEKILNIALILSFEILVFQ